MNYRDRLNSLMEEKGLTDEDLRIIMEGLIYSAELLPHGPYRDYEIRAKYKAKPIGEHDLVWVIRTERGRK